MEKINLVDYGCHDFFVEQYDSLKLKDNDILLGRISARYRDRYKVITENGEISAMISGDLLKYAYEQIDSPEVGDWVTLTNKTVINNILHRRTKLSRKMTAKQSLEQIIVTNIDYVFICTSLNKDLNIRRLERYYTAILNSGAEAIFILTKYDLCNNTESIVDNLKLIFPFVNIHLVSSMYKESLEIIYDYLKIGKTGVLVGSSGVGKSTLINSLVGEEVLLTGEVNSSTDRGKHTTTSKHLFKLPKGGIIIDTPGLRSFALSSIDNANNIGFKDIESFATHCKFSNCSHTTEPGCAVQEAIIEGVLEKERYRNYLKLQNEIEYTTSFVNKKVYYNRLNKMKKRMREQKKL